MKLKVGNRLLAIREDRGMTQMDMSVLLDIPESTYARYERNETQLSYSKVVSFAEILNVPVQELLPETVSITNNNNNSGQGGGVIFGNQYFYLGDDAVSKSLLKENEELKKELEGLKELKEKFLEFIKQQEK